ncbi:MAG: hypothetical protein DRJ01_15460, partial [Bacteroidetes bacterium]
MLLCFSIALSLVSITAIVDITGNGDFLEIIEATTYYYDTDEDVVLYVRPGIYGTFYLDITNPGISFQIIGLNKDECIINYSYACQSVQLMNYMQDSIIKIKNL